MQPNGTARRRRIVRQTQDASTGAQLIVLPLQFQLVGVELK